MEPTDILKTAVATPSGLSGYVRMHFGIHNVAQIFRDFMAEVTRRFLFGFAYLDDFLADSGFGRSRKPYGTGFQQVAAL